VPRGIDDFTGAVRLLAEIVRSIEFDGDRLSSEAHTGFTYATELCDVLTEQRHMTNRVAHRLVGAAVRRATENERDLLPDDLVQAAASLQISHNSPLSDDSFAKAVNPSEIIRNRKTFGGAGPTAVQEILSNQRHAVDASVKRTSALDCAKFATESRRRLAAALAS